MTLNAQKAGANSPPLADIVTMLDHHKPDFLLLAETPRHPHNGALAHTLHNRGYKIHYHPTNAPSHLDTPLEACLSPQLTHTPKRGMLVGLQEIDPIVLHGPTSSPTPRMLQGDHFRDGIDLLTRANATVFACYLPQPARKHDRVCHALSRLPTSVPHHLLVLEGDLRGGWTCASHKDSQFLISLFLFRELTGPRLSTSHRLSKPT